MTNKPIIEIYNASFSYIEDEKKIPVFNDINFVVNQGDMKFIIGETGSGKSTLLSLIFMEKLNLLQGTIKIFGEDVKTASRNKIASIRQQIGIVFQECELFYNLSVIENITLPLRLIGKSETEIIKSGNSMIDWVGLVGYEDRKIRTLSGGEKQKVAIARCMINNPKIVVADEPTGSIDKLNEDKLLKFFEKLNEHGTTVIFATHSTSIMEKYPDKIVGISDRKIYENIWD